MKYEKNLIYRNHWGGGETQVYEVEGYRAVFCLYTGSCFGFFKKEDLEVNELGTGWFPFAKPGKALDDRWDSFRESMEECIDRCVDKAKNPEAHIEWYEKIPDLEEGKWYLGRERRCFSSDNSKENVQKIESGPNFVNWFDDYWKDVFTLNRITGSKTV